MDDPGPERPSERGHGAPKSSWNDSTKTTVAVLVALIAVLAVAAVGVVTVRDATDTVRRAIVTTTTTPGGGQAALPPASDLSPEQAAVVEEVKSQVSAIRGLEWKGALPVKVLTKEQLSERVRQLNAEEIAENRDELDATEAVLKLLQFIGRDVDYAATVDRILAGGVLGFYDDETRELFVGGGGSTTLDAATRSVLAHELVHALTDQHFDFGARGKVLDDEDLTEEAAALGAVIEGDAELVRTLWEERHLNARERQEAAAGGTADLDTYASVPPYLLESLFFPYQDGLNFVRTLHRQGGFASVDGAYRNPPTSTEHILHPETYAAGQAGTPPRLPNLAAATGCGEVDSGSLGEFDMNHLLAREISRADARTAAAGWNGDAYAVVRCGTALGLADRWQTDTPNDATELAEALARWARGWSGASRAPDAEGRFSGPTGSGRVVRDGSRIDLVLAQDQATADRLSRALAGA